MEMNPEDMQNVMGNMPDLSQSTPVGCEECGNEYFEQVLHFRKISKFLTGSDKDQIVPVPTYACSKCGHVNDDFKIKISEK